MHGYRHGCCRHGTINETHKEYAIYIAPINTINRGKEVTLKVKLESANRDIKYEFLLDSGAAISLIKHKCIKNLHEIDPLEKVVLNGITPGRTVTLGSYKTTLVLEDNRELNQKFNVVSNDFPICLDGILGIDFLSENKI